MTAPLATTSSWPRRSALSWLGAALIVAWTIAALRIVMAPADSLLCDVAIDDALYYSLPARHWWQGRGFSFDGLEPTNGVQTLWALVTLGLAGAIDDPTTMLRSQVAISGLAWGAAAVLLFAWLRPRNRAAALLASGGFAWGGLHDRLAFQGMENGLHALLGVVVLLLGTRAETRGSSALGTLGLGTALAAFALNRTEGALLGVVVGAALVLGWLQPSLSRADRLRRALLLALPGIALVGGAALLNQIWFDSWLPISGRVKTFYEQQWGGCDLHGGALRSVGANARQVVNQSLSALRDELAPALATLTGTKAGRWRTALWIAFAVTAVVAIRRAARRPRSAASPWRGSNRFATVFALYACIHLIVMATALPHFTNYGSWYFASETTAVWLVIGMTVATGVGAGRWLAIALAIAIATAGSTRNQVAHSHGTRHLQRGGQWLAANTPPGTVIGTLSSGLVGWHATRQHVINLDGLINNRRYFEDFLRAGRLHDYFDDRGIQWFADYQRRDVWQHGILWHGNIPAERLVPRAYRRTDADHAHAIWQVLPRGSVCRLLAAGDTGVVRDHHVELAVAGDVHGRFPVIGAAALPRFRRDHPDHVVARSLLAEPGVDLLHVMVGNAELSGLGLRDRTVHPEHRLDVEVSPGLHLLGHDRIEGRFEDREFVAVTLFWSCRSEPTARTFEQFELQPGRSGSTPTAMTIANCHGTRPHTEWRAGEVVAETVVLHPLELAAAAKLLVRRASDGREFALED